MCPHSQFLFFDGEKNCAKQHASRRLAQVGQHLRSEISSFDFDYCKLSILSTAHQDASSLASAAHISIACRLLLCCPQSAAVADLDWEDWSGEGNFVHHMLAGSIAGITEHTVMFPVGTYALTSLSETPAAAAALAAHLYQQQQCCHFSLSSSAGIDVHATTSLLCSWGHSPIFPGVIHTSSSNSIRSRSPACRPALQIPSRRTCSA